VVAATTIGEFATPEPARSSRGDGAERTGLEGRAARGVGEIGSGAAGAAFSEHQVDRAVSVSRAAEARYPESLRSVNVQGEVVMSFIVDAKGRVEPRSIKVVSSPHRLFSDAARAALLETRYRPAQAAGRNVRQLAQQSFVFKLQ
jgi:TonB family protein